MATEEEGQFIPHCVSHRHCDQHLRVSVALVCQSEEHRLVLLFVDSGHYANIMTSSG